MYENAHGAAPTHIIEVNDIILESFLGRIEDPKKSKKVELNIINDPAFTTLMIVKIKHRTIRTSEVNTLHAAIRAYTSSIKSLANEHNGRVLKHEANTFLLSFDPVTDTINCDIEIQKSFNDIITPDLVFKIGVSSGTPVTANEGIFEDTIHTAHFLSDITKGKFSISEAVKDLYEGENQNKPIANENGITVLRSTDEEFMNLLMTYTEKVWSLTTIGVNEFAENLGYSKSKLYLTLIKTVGKSPNMFLSHYRLDKALSLLKNNNLPFLKLLTKQDSVVRVIFQDVSIKSMVFCHLTFRRINRAL